MKFNVKTGKSLRGNTSISIHTYWLAPTHHSEMSCLCHSLQEKWKNNRSNSYDFEKNTNFCVFIIQITQQRIHGKQPVKMKIQTLSLKLKWTRSYNGLVKIKLQESTKTELWQSGSSAASYSKELLSLALEKSQPPLYRLFQSQPRLCFVMYHQACLKDAITFGVFSLWFFLHFVQVTSRVILSYMSRESNTIEQSLLSSQGPGLMWRGRGTVQPCWKSC